MGHSKAVRDVCWSNDGRRFLSCVESDKHLAFCPNAACGNAVKYHGVGRPTEVVECTCGAKFWYCPSPYTFSFDLIFTFTLSHTLSHSPALFHSFSGECEQRNPVSC